METTTASPPDRSPTARTNAAAAPARMLPASRDATPGSSGERHACDCQLAGGPRFRVRRLDHEHDRRVVGKHRSIGTSGTHRCEVVEADRLFAFPGVDIDGALPAIAVRRTQLDRHAHGAIGTHGKREAIVWWKRMRNRGQGHARASGCAGSKSESKDQLARGSDEISLRAIVVLDAPSQGRRRK